MDAQQANYFSRLLQHTEQFIEAQEQIANDLQEGFDRDIDDQLSTIVFDGELDHLTDARLVAYFQTITAINALLAANGRQHFRNIRAVLR